jgi:lipopolysaccharide assembly outer membrane protein LptD (OstA)
VTFDEKAGVATATGTVEIAQGSRLLRADRVTYSEKTDTFSATGNVAIVEPNGDVIFGDRGEFTNQFKDGFIEGFRMLFMDNSRLAATGGRRVGGVVTTLGKGVFSPCDLCKDDPSRAPLWRIRAVRVIHDNVRKEVEYKDAFLGAVGQSPLGAADSILRVQQRLRIDVSSAVFLGHQPVRGPHPHSLHLQRRSADAEGRLPQPIRPRRSRG